MKRLINFFIFWLYGYPRAWLFTRVVVFHHKVFSLKELKELLSGVNPNRKQIALEVILLNQGFDLSRPYLFQRVPAHELYEVYQPHWRWKWCAKILPERILIEAIPENA